MSKIRVKEFLNHQEGQDTVVNNWLKGANIDVVDIKYSVGTFQETNQEFSGILVVYKEKTDEENKTNT